MNPADPFGLVGQTLDGQFRVEQLIGEGGFSAVYRGHHLGLNEPVAIKCLKLPGALGPGLVDSFIHRFRDESRILYRLSQGNLNIVRCIAGGTTQAPVSGALVPYMALEWLEGKSIANDFTVRRTLGQHGRSLDEVVKLFDSAADALAFAHAQGVVHRDLNPGNIYIVNTPQGTKTKVLDFGVAKIMDDAVIGLPRVQTMGQIKIFAPAYGAPEQFDDRLGAVGAWSDVYSFALVILESLRDHAVNEGTHLGEFAQLAIDPLHRPTPRVLGLEVSDEVEAVFARALKLEPKDRWQNAADFWQNLVIAAAVKSNSAGTLQAVKAAAAKVGKTLPLNAVMPQIPGVNARPGAPAPPRVPSSPGMPAVNNRAPSAPRVPTAAGVSPPAPAVRQASQPQEEGEVEEATRVAQPDQEVLRTLALADASAARNEALRRAAVLNNAPGHSPRSGSEPPPVSQPTRIQQDIRPSVSPTGPTQTFQALSPEAAAALGAPPVLAPQGQGGQFAMTTPLGGGPQPGLGGQQQQQQQPQQPQGPGPLQGTQMGIPQQGMMPPHGMPPQGMPPQGMPPQGMPPQGPPPDWQQQQQMQQQHGMHPGMQTPQQPPVMTPQPMPAYQAHPQGQQQYVSGHSMPPGSSSLPKNKLPIVPIVGVLVFFVVAGIGLTIYAVRARSGAVETVASASSSSTLGNTPPPKPSAPPTAVVVTPPPPEETPDAGAVPPPEPEATDAGGAAAEPSTPAPNTPTNPATPTPNTPVTPAWTPPTTPTPAVKDAGPAIDPNAWNESAARGKLNSAAGALAFCSKKDGVSGPGAASVTFNTDGSVSGLALEPPYAGLPTGDCVSNFLKRAKTTAFEGSPHTLRFAFVVPAS